MATMQEFKGKWNEIKGQVKQKWGSLTDDDLAKGEGGVEQLVGVVQQKTGRSREEIEHFINEIVNSGSGMKERVAGGAREAMETAREYAEQGRQAAKRGYRQAADTVSSGYESAGDSVRQYPIESVAVCFGVGIAAGVMLGMMLNNR